jgi:hypothetical protein
MQQNQNIRKSLQAINGINLTYCVCDNQKFNVIVRAYRHGEISLESATTQAMSTIIEQPKNQN